MEHYGYPFTENHLREHKCFIENLMALKEEADSENYEIPLLAFRTQLLLFDWFSGHISNSDRHAARHIINTRQPMVADIGSSTLRMRAFLAENSDATNHRSDD